MIAAYPQAQGLCVTSGDHPLFDEKIATSSTLSNPRAASPGLFPVSQSATDYANR
jgi:hypothetical protein